MVELVDKEDKDKINERSNAEDYGKGSEEDFDFRRADEDLHFFH